MHDGNVYFLSDNVKVNPWIVVKKKPWIPLDELLSSYCIYTVLQVRRSTVHENSLSLSREHYWV
jgi:hypothetical protein